MIKLGKQVYAKNHAVIPRLFCLLKLMSSSTLHCVTQYYLLCCMLHKYSNLWILNICTNTTKSAIFCPVNIIVVWYAFLNINNWSTFMYLNQIHAQIHQQITSHHWFKDRLVAVIVFAMHEDTIEKTIWLLCEVDWHHLPKSIYRVSHLNLHTFELQK